MLEKEIKEYLVKTFDINPQTFDNPELLLSDLGLDSLGVVEMLFEVEDKHGIQIDDPMRYAEMKFSEVVADIEKAIKDKVIDSSL